MTDPADKPALSDALFLVEAPDPYGGAPRVTLSLANAPAVLLVLAANRYTRSLSRIYQKRFGIGAMDWRMLSTLTRAPDSSVSQAAADIGIDKAAVSRSLSRLEEKGLVCARTPGPDGRRRLFRLTEAGSALHDEILADALALQKKVLDGFSAEDAARFRDDLQRFIGNLDAMGEAEG